MKTSKRILCLTLILVMALGLVPLASASTTAGYSDSDKIRYTEAIEVLTGIRVVEGTDGAFRPTDPVTRAEAAAILTRMLLTRDVAENLPASVTSFRDVSVSHWATKYISYCSSQGIILGRPDGGFYPGDSVTAAEFAIMLMRALGIGEPSRYVGNNWSANAIYDGIDLGLLTTGVSYTRSATREEIAQYAFNGLIHNPSGSQEKVWGITSSTDGAAGGIVIDYDWITVPGASPNSLLSKKYPTLEPNINDADDFGRPIRTWKYQKNVISTQSIQPITRFNRAVTENDLYTYTGLGADTRYVEKINAIVSQAGSQDVRVVLSALRNSNISSNATIYDKSGYGVITEIYKVGPGKEPADYMAVVIKPTFAAVTVKTTAATSNAGAYDTYSFNAIDSGKVYATHVASAVEPDNVVVRGNVANGDKVLYYWGKDYLYIEAVSAVTGVITSITSTGVVNISEKTTYKANAFSGDDIIPSQYEGTYYIDSSGFILGVKEIADSILRIALVISTDTYGVLQDGRVIPQYFVNIVDINGKFSAVPASTDYKDTLNGTVCGYSVNTKTEEYTFESIDVNTSTDVGTYRVRTSNVTRIESGKVQLITSSSHQVNLANNETRFYIVNPDNTVIAVTGISNISSMTLTKTTAVSFGANRAEPNQIADYVFIYDGDRSEVDTEYIFYLGSYERFVDGVTIDVHQNGEPGTIAGIAEGATGLGQLVDYQLYRSFAVSSTGVVSAVAATSSGADIRGTGLIEFDAGVLFFKGSAICLVDADVPVYTITVAAGIRYMRESLAEDLSITLRTGGYVYVVESVSGSPAAIYVFNLA